MASYSTIGVYSGAIPTDEREGAWLNGKYFSAAELAKYERANLTYNPYTSHWEQHGTPVYLDEQGAVKYSQSPEQIQWLAEHGGPFGAFTRKVWNPTTGQYENKIDWGALGTLAFAGGVTGAGLAGLGGVGATAPAAAAEGGLLPSTPLVSGTVPLATATGVGGEALTPLVGTPIVGGTVPLATAGGVGGTAHALTGAATGAATGGISKTIQDLVTSAATNATSNKLLQLLLGLLGLAGGKMLGNTMTQNAIPPELTQLLQVSVERAKSQTPLFNAMTTGVTNMLPTTALMPAATPRATPPVSTPLPMPTQPMPTNPMLPADPSMDVASPDYAALIAGLQRLASGNR